MSPQPHEGPAEEGLSSSFLRIVHDPEQVEGLRTVLSGFCHRCRNSLNGIKMSLYLFRREARGAVPDCWGELETLYHDIEHLFEHLQTIYRPMPITMVRSPLDDLIDHHVPKWRSWFESRGRTLQLDRPEREVPADFDPAQLGAGLDALAAWRAEAGEARALTRVTLGGRATARSNSAGTSCPFRAIRPKRSRRRMGSCRASGTSVVAERRSAGAAGAGPDRRGARRPPRLHLGPGVRRATPMAAVPAGQRATLKLDGDLAGRITCPKRRTRGVAQPG